MTRFCAFISISCLTLALTASGCGSEDAAAPTPSASGTTTSTATGETTTGGTTGTGCEPACSGKGCGTDGCGGFCGICGSGTACTPAGQCEAVECKPKCQGKECGPDGCGGFCGICAQGMACNGAGVCTGGDTGGCTPSCENMECGDDGCGNQCGKCAPGKVCNEDDGQCLLTDNACGTIDEVGECQQQDTVAVTCKAGKLVAVVCNPNKGLVCGYNESNNKHDCIKAGCSPSCDGKECGSDGCGGQCGQCKPTEVCSSQGLCTQTDICVPNCQGKICGPDGCGGQCGICADPEVCSQGQCINPDACDPDCSGKGCGSDGCGGTCGTCLPTQQCTSNQCVDSGCIPQCIGKSCGSDGCGGSCGDCPESQTCDGGGHCGTAGGGNCGNLTFEGACEQDDKVVKWCEGDQVKTQDCTAFGDDFKCSWVENQETYWCTNSCQSACDGKECGDNGCGASCGSCNGGQVCNDTGTCVAAPGGGECGDITVAGQCEGTTLKYCLNGELKAISCGQYGKTCGWDADLEWNGCNDPAPGECVPNCLLTDGGAKQCGDDGCGNLCGVCDDGQGCTEGVCGEGSGSNECGDVTLDGICEGATLKFCVGEALYTVDCAANDQVCGQSPDNGWFNCMAGEETPGGDDACEGLTDKGMCLDNTIQYCKDGAINTFGCTEFGLHCLFSPTANQGAGGYDCLDDPGCLTSCPEDQKCQHDGSCGCDGITIEGVCEGPKLLWCNGTKLTIETCATGCSIDGSGYADCD